ncbi:hypothetical protein LINPERPRIM_LOCUS30755 [Linum perenne]
MGHRRPLVRWFIFQERRRTLKNFPISYPSRVLAMPECLADQEMAMNTPVSELVLHNNSLLKLVDPATKLGGKQF